MRLPDPRRSRVVLAGVAAGGPAGMPALPAVRHNITGLAEAFTDERLCGIAPGNVTALIDPARSHETGVQVALAAEEADDLLLVYLAGYVHIGAGGLQLALAPSEGRRTGGLALKWVTESMAGSGAGTRVLVIDGRLAAPAGQAPAVTEVLAEQCSHIPDTTSWIFVTDDTDSYAAPGLPGTTFTRTLLALVHSGRSAQRNLFDLGSLDYAVAQRLEADRLPAPALITGPVSPAPVRPDPHRDAARRSRHSASRQDEPAGGAGGGPVALFCAAGQAPPTDLDVKRLHVQLDAAAEAERQWHSPSAVRECYQDVVLTATRLFGPAHPRTLHARHMLAHWSGKSGTLPEAIALYRALFADRNQLLGADHSETIDTYNDLMFWSQR